MYTVDFSSSFQFNSFGVSASSAKMTGTDLSSLKSVRYNDPLANQDSLTLSSDAIRESSIQHARRNLSLRYSDISTEMGGSGQYAGLEPFTVADRSAEDQLLNERINQTLKKAGIRLERDEVLNFKINQNGRISVGGDFSDEKRAAIEKALNSNAGLGEEILKSQIAHLDGQERDKKPGYVDDDQKSAVRLHSLDSALKSQYGVSLDDFEASSWGVGSDSASAYNAWENGLSIRCTAQESEGIEERLFLNEPSMYFGIDRYVYETPGASTSFELEISYYNGQLVRDPDNHPDRMPGVFNDRNDSFEGLCKIIGLDVACTDRASFLDALNIANGKENDALNDVLNQLLEKAGLGEENRKITFAEDADGNIVIEGNIRADKKEELEQLVNQDKSLVRRLKDHKAKLEIAQALGGKTSQSEDGQGSVQMNPDVFGFDLATPDLAAARKQLLDGYLADNGFSLADVSTKTDGETGKEIVGMFDENGDAKTGNDELQALLGDFWELEDELYNYVQDSTQTTRETNAAEAITLGDSASKVKNRPLFEMKRGEMSEAVDEEALDLDQMADSVRSMVAAAVKLYNEEIAQYDPDKQIVDYSLEISDKGRLSIKDLKTKGGDDKDVLRAWEFVTKQVGGTSETSEAFALAVMDQHDDEHGDVKEYKHYIAMSKTAGEEFLILSPDADKAALADMNKIGGELNTMFNQLFGSFGADSFDIFWNVESGLSLDGVFGATGMGQRVSSVLDDLNKRLKSDDPFAKTDDDKISLNGQTEGVLKKLLELEEAHGRLHDPTLKKFGMKFTVAPGQS